MNMWRQTCENCGKQERKETSKAIRPMRAKERVFGWSKVKVSGLHLLWLDVKSVKGRKEGEMKKEIERPFGQWRWAEKVKSRGGEEVKPREKRSPSKWDWGLVQSWRITWVRASKREEKNREGKRKYKMRKRVVSEKKNGVFLYSSFIYKCCNLYLI